MKIPMVVKPLSGWHREETKDRRHSPFRANWSSTVELLRKELRALKAKDSEIRLAVEEHHIRHDGWIRSDARPKHPGVEIVLDSKYGRLVYTCDKFNRWEDNVRAISLTLERLRTAEMYGCTKRGEQYSGFKALPAPDANGFETVEDAAVYLERTLKNLYSRFEVMEDVLCFTEARKRALKKHHPDKRGRSELFVKTQAACKLLQAHHDNQDDGE